METQKGFGKGIASLWRSGLVGKLFLSLSIFLMIGLLDAGPRYLRYFSTAFGSPQQTEPVKLPQGIATYAVVAYEESFTQKLQACVTRVRDSLVTAGERKSKSTPLGYEMIALRPDFQISNSDRPLDSTSILIFLDARLECDCDANGYFRLVRFVVDPINFHVRVLRDEQVSWYAYLGKNMPKAS